MRVQIRPTSVGGAWYLTVEQACADAVDQDRQDAFLCACRAAGLAVQHRVVRTLAADLVRIRPPDVWLRIIASHLAQSQREVFPLKALDHGLSSLRLADAYANRPNADAEVAARLLAAVVLQLPYPAVEHWRDWHANKKLAAPQGEDVVSMCSDAGRYAPLSMVTAVGSHFGDWATRFTSVVENLEALEHCGSEIVAWRRGRRGNPGLSGRWAQTPPTTEERSTIEAALNGFAENVFVSWQDAKPSVSSQWVPLLNDCITGAIRFAVVAAELINGDVDA